MPEEAEEGEAVGDEKQDTGEAAVAEEPEIYLKEVTEVESMEKKHEEAEKVEEDSGDQATEATDEEAMKEEDADGEEQVAGEEEAEEREETEEGEKAEDAEEVAVQEEAREEGQKEEEAQELQEKQEGEEQPEARRGPSLSPLEALESLQSDLEPVNKQASRSYSWIRLKSCQRRQSHLEHRSALIRGIAGFWAKAVSFMLSLRGSAVSGLVHEEREGGGC